MGWYFRMTILEKEDWKGVVDIVTNAKLVVSSIQDVAHKLADYASISSTNTSKLKCFYNFIKKIPQHSHSVLMQDVLIYLLQHKKSSKEKGSHIALGYLYPVQ